MQALTLAWQIIGPIIRLTHLDRRLWKRHVEHLDVAGGWKGAMSQVEARAAFFDAIPYRPEYSAPFDQEKLLLSTALAVANRKYFLSDLDGYRKVVRRVGSYLENSLITNEREVSESDVWADYLHHKATIESLFGQPAIAACINSEVKQLFAAKEGRLLDALTYEGCTMCCRVESISSDEHYLLSALSSQTEDLARRIRDIPDVVPSAGDITDIATRALFIHLLRCKVQAHMREPDANQLEQAIADAKRCREHITGQDASTYDVVVTFYEAYLSKVRKQPAADTRSKYDACLQAVRLSRVPHFCLLRVPDPVASALANHVQLPRLASDSTLSALKRAKNIQFSVHVGVALLLAVLAPLLFNVVAPFSQVSAGLTSWKGAWFAAYGFTTGVSAIAIWARKLGSERSDRGIVSPSLLNAADISCWVYLALAVTLFGAAASERITLPSQ